MGGELYGGQDPIALYNTCDCSCHDCCVPLWAACDECDLKHPPDHDHPQDLAAFGRQKRLAAIKARRGALQSLPWVVHEPDMWNDRPWLAGPLVCADVRGDRTERADMEFIAHAPDDLDWLISEVEDGLKEVDDLRESIREFLAEIDRLNHALVEVERGGS